MHALTNSPVTLSPTTHPIHTSPHPIHIMYCTCIQRSGASILLSTVLLEFIARRHSCTALSVYNSPLYCSQLHVATDMTLTFALHDTVASAQCVIATPLHITALLHRTTKHYTHCTAAYCTAMHDCTHCSTEVQGNALYFTAP